VQSHDRGSEDDLFPLVNKTLLSRDLSNSVEMAGKLRFSVNVHVPAPELKLVNQRVQLRFAGLFCLLDIGSINVQLAWLYCTYGRIAHCTR